MQFLEQDQSNTRVYISYAMALNKLEGYKSAKKVFDLAFEGRDMMLFIWLVLKMFIVMISAWSSN